MRTFSTRFAAITQLGARLTCEGHVTELFEHKGERARRLALTTKDENGETKLAGEAVIALYSRRQTHGETQGKVALITGSGRGIGRAIALKLASEGARVVVNDLDAAPGDAVADEIRAAGGEAIAVNGSVTEPVFADRFVGAAIEHFGGLDIIVNNAGYTWDSTIQKMTDEQFQAMLDVHLVAPFRILRAAAEPIRIMAEEGGRSRPRGVPQGRQHLLDRGALRQRRPGELFVGQGVAGRPDAHAVQGMGTLQGQRQLRRLRPDQDPPDPADRNRSRRPSTSPAATSRSGSSRRCSMPWRE